MKNYLGIFKKREDYDLVVDTDLEPDISYVIDEIEIETSQYDPLKRCLSFIALEDCMFKFSGASTTAYTLRYSLDFGKTWVRLEDDTYTPTISKGDKIIWKAYSMTPQSGLGIGSFISTGKFVAEGNVMSLLYGDNFKGKIDLTGNDYAFFALFSNNDKLVSAKNLSLPATTLSNSCYGDMFISCTSLIDAPELPATTLANNCYSRMFDGCISLKDAPELPATTLANNCYSRMFNRCISLTTAPVLLSTTLVSGCYQRMFYGCTNLNSITCLAKDISATNCTNIWVSGVASNGTFTKAKFMSDWTIGDNGIPTGWEYDSEIVAKFNVTNTSEPTQIASDTIGFRYIEIDGVEQPSVVNTYTFDTIGEHTVKYMLIDQTNIGDSVFTDCYVLTNITIPDVVTNIGNKVFQGCSGLTSIAIPNNVMSIGSGMCSGCTSLTNVTIGNSVTSIGDYAFGSCSNLISIDIPSGVTSISNDAFTNCGSFTSITVDSNNSVYDSRNDCNAIIETSSNTLIRGCKNTIVPNDITIIGNSAFSNCGDLVGIELPSSLKTIRDSAFAGCTGLTSIDIPNSVTSIGISSFWGCTSLTSIELPSGLTTISNYVFINCSGLTSVTIGDSVTSIGMRAFSGCTNLTSIDVPNRVITINNGAFANCRSMTSCVIGNGIKLIDQAVFQFCVSLTSLTCNATTAPTTFNQTFLNVKTGGTLYVPIGSSGYSTWPNKLGGWTLVEQ